MKNPTKRALWGVSFSLAAPTVECFVICGGTAVSTFQRGPLRCAHRPLREGHTTSGRATTVTASSRPSDSPLGLGSGFGSLVNCRAGLAGSSRLRQAFRLYATEEEQDANLKVLEAYLGTDGGEEEDEDEGGYDSDGKNYGKDGEGDEGGEVGQDGEYVVKSEWHACVGNHNFFAYLPPIAEYDPLDIPDNAMYSADELRYNIGMDRNPFELHSFWVDRSITVGNIDEEKREAIEPMMKVIEQVCELIDTTDDVFSFKYSGLIANRKGIEAWTKKLIKEIYPGVKDVHLVTNRTRDPRDH